MWIWKDASEQATFVFNDPWGISLGQLSWDGFHLSRMWRLRPCVCMMSMPHFDSGRLFSDVCLRASHTMMYLVWFRAKHYIFMRRGYELTECQWRCKHDLSEAVINARPSAARILLDDQCLVWLWGKLLDNEDKVGFKVGLSWVSVGWKLYNNMVNLIKAVDQWFPAEMNTLIRKNTESRPLFPACLCAT